MIRKAFYASVEKIKERINKYKNVKYREELSDIENKELECIEQNGNLNNGDVLDVFKKSVFNGNNETYYHYTDLNGILGIFKNYINSTEKGKVKNCVMWASNIRFLNDAQEYLEGKKKYGEFKSRHIKTKYTSDKLDVKSLIGNCLCDYLDEEEKRNLEPPFEGNDNGLSEKYKDFYSISFCGKNDLLSQWKYYGKNSGIAIEFNFDGATCHLSDSKDEIAICPLTVAYTDLEKLILYIMSALTYTDHYVVEDPQEEVFIPFCKAASFSEEVESRLVFARQNEKCEYMVSDGIIKPYIPVEFTAAPGENIIKSITVGPGQNQNLVYNALIHIFNTDEFIFQEDKTRTVIENNGGTSGNGGNKIIIKKSSIPFRG